MTPLLVALAALALVASARSDVLRHWTMVHCDAPAASDTMSFQVYLKMSNTHLLDDFTTTGSDAALRAAGFDTSALAGASIEAKLAMWRSVLAPTRQHIKHTQQWLAPAACRQEWDHFQCENVPAAVVAALFGARVCTYRQVAPTAAPRDYLLLDAGAKHVCPAGVYAVYGATLFDPTLKPKHHARRRAPARTPFRHTARSAGGALAANTKPEDWPSPMPTGAPLIVGAFIQGNVFAELMVAISCSDGSMTKSAHSLASVTPAAHWCSNGNTPTSVSFRLFHAAGAYDQTLMQPINVSNCISGATGDQPVVPTSDAHKDQVLCFFTPPFTGLGNNVRYELEATQHFAGAPDSSKSRLRNYYRGQFFNAAFKPGVSNVSIINPQSLTPALIKAIYGIPANARGQSSSAAQGFLEFGEPTQPAGGFSTSDLVAFLVQQGIVQQSQAAAYVARYLKLVNSAESVDTDETTLDVELMMGIAPYIPTVMWNVLSGPGTPYNGYVDSFIAWAANITSGNSGLSPIPTVWSISYGGEEWGTQSNHLDRYFQTMSASGISVFASSGDGGAGWSESISPLAEFPASAPHCVAVGATALHQPNGTAPAEEITCSSIDSNVITSGGAFSSQFALPAYQAVAVSGYISDMRQIYGSQSNFDQQYPGNRRALPDVSAIGANIVTYIQGQTQLLYGTSASSPITAAMVSLINDALYSQGKSPAMLIHNTIYRAPTNFTDITKGDNCAGEIDNTVDNFYVYPKTECYITAPGWDAATGLGSTKFAAFMQTVLAQPSPTTTATRRFAGATP